MSICSQSNIESQHSLSTNILKYYNKVLQLLRGNTKRLKNYNDINYLKQYRKKLAQKLLPLGNNKKKWMIWFSLQLIKQQTEATIYSSFTKLGQNRSKQVHNVAGMH